MISVPIQMCILEIHLNFVLALWTCLSILATNLVNDLNSRTIIIIFIIINSHFPKINSLSKEIFESLVLLKRRTKHNYARHLHARYVLTRLCGRGAAKNKLIYIYWGVRLIPLGHCLVATFVVEACVRFCLGCYALSLSNWDSGLTNGYVGISFKLWPFTCFLNEFSFSNWVVL